MFYFGLGTVCLGMIQPNLSSPVTFLLTQCTHSSRRFYPVGNVPHCRFGCSGHPWFLLFSPHPNRSVGTLGRLPPKYGFSLLLLFNSFTTNPRRLLYLLLEPIPESSKWALGFCHAPHGQFSTEQPERDLFKWLIISVTCLKADISGKKNPQTQLEVFKRC